MLHLLDSPYQIAFEKFINNYSNSGIILKLSGEWSQSSTN